MTREDLKEKLAKKMGPGFTQEKADEVITIMLDSIKKTVAEGKRVEIRKFGVFKLRVHRPQLTRNPRTGEPLQIPAKNYPMFKASRWMNDLINNGA